jgi:alcohol dehydrogenase (cytochrome c)
MRIPAFGMFLAVSVWAQTPDAGRRVFESRCARCHGPEGGGGELGPAIAARVAARSDQELSALITLGLPARGMPAFE